MFQSLTPFTKFLLFILTMVAALLSNDTRFLGLLALFTLLCLHRSKLKFSKFFWMIILLHLLISYVVNPDYGVTLYRYDISWLGDMTLQEGLYLLTLGFKDVIILGFLQLFCLTSYPSALAATLNQFGLPTRLAYHVEQLFWLIPNFNHHYAKLQLAAAAQGVELTKFDLLRRLLKARQKSSLARRQLGKKAKRTWYCQPQLLTRDKVAILLAIFSVIISIGLIFVNGGRLWNPFR